MKLYTKSNIYYPLLLLFINIKLLNGVKNLQIGLHAMILNENVLSLRNVFFWIAYSTAYNPSGFYDRNKLFAVLKWSVNCILKTCYFF